MVDAEHLGGIADCISLGTASLIRVLIHLLYNVKGIQLLSLSVIQYNGELSPQLSDKLVRISCAL